MLTIGEAFTTRETRKLYDSVTRKPGLRVHKGLCVGPHPGFVGRGSSTRGEMVLFYRGEYKHINMQVSIKVIKFNLTETQSVSGM